MSPVRGCAGLFLRATLRVQGCQCLVTFLGKTLEKIFLTHCDKSVGFDKEMSKNIYIW